MIRHRASTKGGNDRTTITLPTDVGRKMRKYLAKRPGLTISAFITRAIEKVLGIEHVED